MVRFILSVLGWAMIVIGGVEVLFEFFRATQFEGNQLPGFRYDNMGNGFVNMALGAIMLGIEELLKRTDGKKE